MNNQRRVTMGEKIARLAGRHTPSHRGDGCDIPSMCSRIAAIRAHFVVHGALSVNEEEPLMLTRSC